MFTGITRGTHPITRADHSADLLRYAVQLDETLCAGLEIGASVAIDGVCQTVTRLEGSEVFFDAIRETLDKTTLGDLDVGTMVSVERSFRVGDEIGGHEVAGHVMGTGTVREVSANDERYDFRVEVPVEWIKYIQPKGFIAIDGSSLTVGEVDSAGSFWLHLIPETLRLTNLGSKGPGARVNVELEARTVTIVDTVERILEQRFRDETTE
ncbi:MAG: riboflavin synthase subunit alpha [Acidobacteriota bacterium]